MFLIFILSFLFSSVYSWLDVVEVEHFQPIASNDDNTSVLSDSDFGIIDIILWACFGFSIIVITLVGIVCFYLRRFRPWHLAYELCINMNWIIRFMRWINNNHEVVVSGLADISRNAEPRVGGPEDIELQEIQIDDLYNDPSSIVE